MNPTQVTDKPRLKPRESSLAEVWEGGLRVGWHHEAVRALFEGRPDSPVLRALPSLEKPLHIGCSRSAGVAAA